MLDESTIWVGLCMVLLFVGSLAFLLQGIIDRVNAKNSATHEAP